MVEGPMPCPESDLPELFALLDRVFRSGCPAGTTASQYPICLTPSNRENLRIIKDGGRIASHVCLSILDARVLGASVRVACVGAVCTDDWARGRGHATALMADAIAHARGRGCSLMLVSGGRGLYLRAGCIGGDTFLRGSVPADERAARTRLAQHCLPRHIPALVALHQSEVVRFVRPADEWGKLLSSAAPNGCAVETYVVGDEREVVAYLSCQPDRGDDYLSVIEFGGSRRVVCGMASDLASRFGRGSADFAVQPGDRDMVTAFRASGFPLDPRPFPGTFRLIDIPAFLDAFAPLLSERLGRGAWSTTCVRVEEEAVVWQRGHEQIEWRGVSDVTERVFTQAVPDGADTPLAVALAALFPLPLPWYGLNYC